jgi:hypothetical protein
VGGPEGEVDGDAGRGDAGVDPRVARAGVGAAVPFGAPVARAGVEDGGRTGVEGGPRVDALREPVAAPDGVAPRGDAGEGGGATFLRAVRHESADQRALGWLRLAAQDPGEDQPRDASPHRKLPQRPRCAGPTTRATEPCPSLAVAASRERGPGDGRPEDQRPSDGRGPADAGVDRGPGVGVLDVFEAAGALDVLDRRRVGEVQAEEDAAREDQGATDPADDPGARARTGGRALRLRLLEGLPRRLRRRRVDPGEGRCLLRRAFALLPFPGPLEGLDAPLDVGPLGGVRAELEERAVGAEGLVVAPQAVEHGGDVEEDLRGVGDREGEPEAPQGVLEAPRTVGGLARLEGPPGFGEVIGGRLRRRDGGRREGQGKDEGPHAALREGTP